MNLDTRYTHHPDVQTRELGGQVVLEDQRTGRSLALNPMGSAIWMDLAAPKSANDLTAILKELYPKEPDEKLQSGVTQYLQQLQKEELVVAAS